jgi:FAD/FMN-containing dehydrogenase
MTPLPTDTACVFLKFESLGRAMEALQTIRRNLGSALVAFELISSQALLVTTENAPNIQAPWDGSLGDESFTALVQAETFGDGSAEHSLVRSIAALIDAGLGPVDSAFVPVESAWALRHSISSALARAGHVLGLDIAVPVHRLAAARRRIRDFVTDRAPTAILADFGHAGDGGLHANVLFPHRTPPPDRAGLDELRLGLSKLVVREEGTFSAEHGIGPANAAIWQELATETDRRAWHALKARWDPAGIFGRPLGPDPLPEPAG